MDIQNEILDKVNTKYVLLKKGRNYLIVDKDRKTMVIIDDPLINVNLLIKKMIEKGVEIFFDTKSLPEPKEKLFKHDSLPANYSLFVKRLYNQDSVETGAIISALTNKPINREDKEKIERLIQNYAFTVLYPNEGLNLFSSIYNDTASMTIIKGINNLPHENIDGEQITLYDW
jgi:hypothetical protein